MKFSAKVCQLSDALALASANRSGANSSSIVHIATAEDAVSIRCADIALGTIATRVYGMIHEQGEIAVSLGRLAAVVSGFAPGAVVETGDLNHQCHGRGDLLPHRLFGKVEIGH